ETVFPERRDAANQAHDRSYRFGKTGEDSAFGRRSARKFVADERDRPDAIARDGPKELPAHADQGRREVRGVFRRRSGEACDLRIPGGGCGGVQGATLDGGELPARL